MSQEWNNFCSTQFLQTRTIYNEMCNLSVGTIDIKKCNTCIYWMNCQLLLSLAPTIFHGGVMGEDVGGMWRCQINVTSIYIDELHHIEVQTPPQLYNGTQHHCGSNCCLWQSGPYLGCPNCNTDFIIVARINLMMYMLWMGYIWIKKRKSFWVMDWAT